MAVKIFPTAKARILEIWDYTENKWGEEQADRYVTELVRAIHGLLDERRHWRPVKDKTLPDVFFLRHERHYIFFRELSRDSLGVISILHENMNFPSRLKVDAGQIEED